MLARKWQRKMLDYMVRKFPGLGLGERAEGFVKLFEHSIPNGSRVLDIGGGWGFYAEPLENRGHEVTVLDVVKPGYQKAPVVIYDGNQVPFDNKSYDVSLFMTVLHHIPDPEAVLSEAKRVTRKHIIVVEDLYQHAIGRCWTILRDRIYNFEYFGHPCQFKKREEWLEIFSRQGFSVVEEKQVYTWMAGLRILNGIFILKPNIDNEPSSN